MESTKTNIEGACNISNTRIYFGDNKELICVKVYSGDWGDWDEKPELIHTNIHNSSSILNDNFEG